jgi:hypothetical protein
VLDSMGSWAATVILAAIVHKLLAQRQKEVQLVPPN